MPELAGAALGTLNDVGIETNPPDLAGDGKSGKGGGAVESEVLDAPAEPACVLPFATGSDPACVAELDPIWVWPCPAVDGPTPGEADGAELEPEGLAAIAGAATGGGVAAALEAAPPSLAEGGLDPGGDAAGVVDAGLSLLLEEPVPAPEPPPGLVPWSGRDGEDGVLGGLSVVLTNWDGSASSGEDSDGAGGAEAAGVPACGACWVDTLPAPASTTLVEPV